MVIHFPYSPHGKADLKDMAEVRGSGLPAAAYEFYTLPCS